METMKQGYALNAKFDYDHRSSENNGLLSPAWIAGVDFSLLTFSFLLINYLKRGTPVLSREYTGLLLLFYLCWFITSIIAKKFRPVSFSMYCTGVVVLFKAVLYLTYTVAFLVVVFGLPGYSREHIFSTCLLLFFLETVAWSLYHKTVNRRRTDRLSVEGIVEYLRFEMDISYSLLVVDVMLLLISFYCVQLIKRGHLSLLPGYDALLLVLLGVWFVVSLGTGKFVMKEYRNIYFHIWQWLKAGIVMLAVTTVVIFAFRLFQYSRFQALGTVVLLTALEGCFVCIYFRGRKDTKTDQDLVSADLVRKLLQQDALPLDVDLATIRQRQMRPARYKLEKRLLPGCLKLFDFIDQHIDIDDMLCMETSVERRCDPIDVDADRALVRLYLNLCKFNDIRRLNLHFLQMYHLLLPGGYFVGYGHTIKTHHQWIYNKFPKYLAHMVYGLDFCFRRVMPKLPCLQKIYFAMTNGKNRAISRAEFLGRLCFCGFEIVAETVIDKRLYVIARKVKTTSLDTSPTYGPFVKLKRSGINNSVLHTYKFRTMHPYSEYLQQYVYDQQGLQKGGKLKEDFRMTTWGKIMRKLWLDELPMLYNWLRGDLQIVGVRPLSFHYLSLYDAELKELRKKVRPGLIPPYYADLPETFEEICDSEKRYIKSYLNHPIKTQCCYFYRAFVNIAFKGARSK